jgi:hypothetical protein
LISFLEDCDIGGGFVPSHEKEILSEVGEISW